MNFHNLWFLYPIGRGPTDRPSHNLKTGKAFGLTIPESLKFRSATGVLPDYVSTEEGAAPSPD